MAYEAKGGYISSLNYNYINLTAEVLGSSTVKLKTRLHYGGSYYDMISSSGAGWHTNQYSMPASTDFYWEYQWYESGSSYGPLVYGGANRTPDPPAPVIPGTPSLSLYSVSGKNITVQVNTGSNTSGISFDYYWVGGTENATMSAGSNGTYYHSFTVADYNTSYSMDCKATGPGGSSGWSNSISFTSGPPPGPNAPTSLSTYGRTRTTINFQGTVSSPSNLSCFLTAQIYNDAGYSSYRTSFSTSSVSSGSVASGLITGLTPGTTYYWKAYTTDSNYNNSNPPVTVGSFTTLADNNPLTPISMSTGFPSGSTIPFQGTVRDDEGDDLFLRAWVYTDAGYTQQHGIYDGSIAKNGQTSSGTITGLGLGTYYWQAQTMQVGEQKYSSKVPVGSFTIKTDWKWTTGADVNGNKVSGSTFTMTASEWNAFTGKINQIRSLKGYPSASFTTAYSGNEFTASMMNEAIGAINYMLGTGVSPKARGNPINASDLNALKNTLNSVT